MKIIYSILLIVLSFSNMMGQGFKRNWREFYINKLIVNPQFNIIDKNKEIDIEFPIYNEFTFNKDTFEKIIENDTYTEYLSTFDFSRELSNVHRVLSFKEISYLIKKLIQYSDDKTILVYTSDEYNVFLNLYNQEDGNIENIKTINFLLREYLNKALNLYPAEWLENFRLLCEFEEQKYIKALFEKWDNNLNTDKDKFFSLINEIRFLKFDLDDVNKEYEKVLESSLEETHKNFLIYCLSSNEYLTDEEKNSIYRKIVVINISSLDNFDLSLYHSSLKNLNKKYILPSEIRYVEPIEWTINNLRYNNIIDIKNTTSFYLHTRLSYFNLQTEKILSWIFNYNGGLSSLYAIPEPSTLNRTGLSEIFFKHLSENDMIQYTFKSEEEKISLTFKYLNEIIESEFVGNDSYQLGLYLEYLTNLLLELVNSNKRLVPFNFEYPLYFILEEEKIDFLIMNYGLIKEK